MGSQRLLVKVSEFIKDGKFSDDRLEADRHQR
jgi:hypothetical protein